MEESVKSKPSGVRTPIQNICLDFPDSYSSFFYAQAAAGYGSLCFRKSLDPI